MSRDCGRNLAAARFVWSTARNGCATGVCIGVRAGLVPSFHSWRLRCLNFAYTWGNASGRLFAGLKPGAYR